MYHHPSTVTTFDHYPARRKTPDQDDYQSGPSSSKKKVKEIVLYKTEYCRNWSELGYCRYGEKCRYAHGVSELRDAPRHMLYKTQICRAYHDQGECPYGIRCTFIHGESHRALTKDINGHAISNTQLSSPDSLSSSSTTSCSSSTTGDCNDFGGIYTHEYSNSAHFVSPSYMINYYDDNIPSYNYIHPYLPLAKYPFYTA